MTKHFRLIFVSVILLSLMTNPVWTAAQDRHGKNIPEKVKPYKVETRNNENVQIPEAYRQRSARTTTPYRKTLKQKSISNPDKFNKRTKSGMQPIMKTPDGTELWGNIIYANSWESLTEDDKPPFSISSFNANSNVTFKTIFQDTSLQANGGGAFLNGKFHFINFGVFMTYVFGYYYQYDTNTWDIVKSTDVSDKTDLFAFDTSVDPTTDRVYGCFYDNNFEGKVFGYVDYESLTRTTICSLTRPYFTIAVNGQGEVYGIDELGDLYKIEKLTGEQTRIGSTGLTPYYLQSATFDKKTNKLYWAAYFQNANSALYEVNTSTGAATKIADFPDNEEVICLTIPEPAAEEGAPAKIEDLELNYPKGTLAGSVKFTAPSLTYSGANLPNTPITYTIQVNNTVMKTGEVNPGEAVDIPVTLTTSGNTTFIVYTNNDAGRSPLAKASQWIGQDNPTAPTACKLNINEETYAAKVTWRAPTAGTHGGYPNTTQITYDVIRYPGKVKVATKQTGLSFTETLPQDALLTAYYYEIIPYNGNLKGVSGYTNKQIIGNALEVPFYEYFSSEDDFNLFTIVDSNNDGISWKWAGEVGAAYCSYSTENNSDDWLLTPEIRFDAGRIYNLQFSACRGMNQYPQSITAAYGQGTDPKQYTEVLPLTILPQGLFQQFKFRVKISESGNYRFGIHDVSYRDSYRTYVDSVIITAGPLMSSPDTVTNLKLEANPEGLGDVTISFNAPTKDIAGNQLENISKIEIYRNSKLIKTFDNPSLGAPLSYVDNGALNGFNTYMIVGYKGNEKGEERTDNVYVGYDIPFEPQNVTLSENGETPLLTWSAPSSKGINNGFVDIEDLTYNIYTYNLKTTTFEIEKSKQQGLSYQPAMDMTGEQDLAYYGVTAVSEIGESDYGLSNLYIKGAPYTLPFIETFKKGRLDNKFWWVDTDASFVPNSTYSADENIGSADWSPSGDANVASFNSGKITLKGSVNPILHFSHRGQPLSDYRFILNVMTPDGKEHTMKTIDYRTITGEKRWIREEVDLSQFKNELYIILKFKAEKHETKSYTVSFDAVELYNILPYNLKAQKITPQLTGTVGSPMSATVNVRNLGQQSATGFDVNVYLNNEIAATVDGGTLGSFVDSTYTLTFTPKLKNVGKASVYATVEYANDLDPEDNTTLPVDITIKPSELPVVNDLVGSLESDGVSLAWTHPADNSKLITEDFESYAPFSIDNIGEWTLYDGDKLNTIGISYSDWPNINLPQAYIVFCPREIGFASLKRYTPHSGANYMASLAAYTYDEGVVPYNDDWLISPELEGNAQMISFFAKGGLDEFGPESFEILYSTTGTDVDNFTLISSHTVGDAEWLEFTANLPEGTKYFAIRCTSSNKFALFIDDVSYHKGSLKRTGYNIYRDGVLVGTTSADATTYKDTQVNDAPHVYTVTVVYEEGESPMSNEATITSGIDEVGTGVLTVRGETGQIRILNAEEKLLEIYTTNGSMIYRGDNERNNLVVPAQRGIYLVKVGERTFNISVK